MTIFFSDFMFDDKEWTKFFKMYFWKPWPHTTVYFIGFLFGYILPKLNKTYTVKNVNFSNIINNTANLKNIFLF